MKTSRVAAEAAPGETSVAPALQALRGPPIQVGARVRLCGLKAQPHLNGQCGVAAAWHADEERWKVAMDDGSTKIAKAINLEQHAAEANHSTNVGPQLGVQLGCRVVVSGIQAQPSLNGQHGTVVGWDDAEGRWKVVMDDGGRKMLKPTNVGALQEEHRAAERSQWPGNVSGIVTATPEFADGLRRGARVRVLGTGTLPDLRGQVGTVVNWDEAEEWWGVVMDNGSHQTFLRADLEPCILRSQPATAVSKELKKCRDEVVVDTGASDTLRSPNGAVAPERRPIEGHQEATGSGVAATGPVALGTPPGLAASIMTSCATVCPSTARSLGPGARVCVSGIKSQPHLNGQLGTLVEWDSGEQRWKVIMDDGTGKLMRPVNLELLPGELAKNDFEEAVAGTPSHASSSSINVGVRVRVHGIKVQPELNGQTGTIMAFAPAEGRWRLLMDSGAPKLLRPVNLEVLEPATNEVSCVGVPSGDSVVAQAESPPVVPMGEEGRLWPGARIIVSGIKAQPELNGLLGSVVAWDVSQSRWKVVMENGSKRMFRPTNIALCADEAPNVLQPVPQVDGSVRACTPEIASEGKNLEGASAECCTEAQQNLNGQFGTASAREELEGRCKVVMDDGARKLLMCPENISIAEGLHANAAPCNLLEVPTACRSSPDVAEGAGRSSRLEEQGSSNALRKEPPSLNDQCGIAVKLDHEEERWKEPAQASTGPGLQPGCRVRVLGVKAQPSLNGQHGTAIEWDLEQERWKVIMDDGGRKLLRSTNIEALSAATGECGSSWNQCSPSMGGVNTVNASVPSHERCLRAGSRVRVIRVKMQPELNGQFGTLVGWVDHEARWKVAMDNGFGKMLRPANVEEIDGSDEPNTVENVGGSAASVHTSSHRLRYEGAHGDLQPCSPVMVHEGSTQPHLNGHLGTAAAWDQGEERWKVLMGGFGTREIFQPGHMEAVDSDSAAGLHASGSSFPPRTPGLPAIVADPTRQDIQAGSRVRVRGIKAQPHLNGQLGTAMEWVAEEQRWKVVMDDSSRKMLREANLHLAETEEQAELPHNVPDKVPEDLGGSKSTQRLCETSLSLTAGVDEKVWPGARVRVSGINSQPQLNGMCGTAVQWDTSEGRWKVVMDDGARKMFRPGNISLCDWNGDHTEVLMGRSMFTAQNYCEAASSSTTADVAGKPREPSVPSPEVPIQVGGRVQLTGLKAQPRLNGQLGTAIEWVEDEQRWKVVMDDGSGKMLRPINLAMQVSHDTASHSQTSVRSGSAAQLSQGPGPNASGTAGFLPGARARVVGVEGRPQLNGRCGTVIQWVPSKSRWKVVMDDGSRKMFCPINLILTQEQEDEEEIECV